MMQFYHKYLELPIQKTVAYIAAMNTAATAEESTTEEAEFI